MANRIGIDLQGRTVVLPNGRRFVCVSGFGCSYTLRGTSIFGHYEHSDETARVSGMDIVRLAHKPKVVSGRSVEDMP